MQILDLSWKRVTKIWWSFTWRIVVAGVVAGVAMGFILPWAMALAGISYDAIGSILNIASVAIAIPIGIWAMMEALDKRYTDFSIILSPADPTEDHIEITTAPHEYGTTVARSNQPKEPPRSAA